MCFKCDGKVRPDAGVADHALHGNDAVLGPLLLSPLDEHLSEFHGILRAILFQKVVLAIFREEHCLQDNYIELVFRE